jgi:hypothetical protein
MRVRSALANMEVAIGSVSRRGNDLILKSAASSNIDTEIAVSAREALAIIGRILATRAGWLFVLGLPFAWLRRESGSNTSHAAPPTQVNINKPW